MYLSNNQVVQINDAIRELKKLSTMPGCTVDRKIKYEMRHWVRWIAIYAQQIEDGLNNDLYDCYL